MSRQTTASPCVRYTRPATINEDCHTEQEGKMRWKDGFTQFARDTTLLSRRVASQTVLPAEAWTERPLLKGVAGSLNNMLR